MFRPPVKPKMAKCLECCDVFAKIQYNQIFCTRKCAQSNYNRKHHLNNYVPSGNRVLERVCQGCKIHFTYTYTFGTLRNWCSAKCHSKYFARNHAVYKKPVSAKCITCLKAFQQTRSNKLHCSERCSRKVGKIKELAARRETSKKLRLSAKCIRCGMYANRGNTQAKYCHKCKSIVDYSRQNIKEKLKRANLLKNKKCSQCGISISPKTRLGKYCSAKCRKENHYLRNRTEVGRVCVDCSMMYTLVVTKRLRAYGNRCGKCHLRHMRGSSEDHYLRGISRRRRRIARLPVHHCVVCGDGFKITKDKGIGFRRVHCRNNRCMLTVQKCSRGISMSKLGISRRYINKEMFDSYLKILKIRILIGDRNADNEDTRQHPE